ncbi:MAG: IgGFc-binding protein [Proteobacteria bacterium]|nr:IgGFc-binding protein [Pseudomonadota bacterium]
MGRCSDGEQTCSSDGSSWGPCLNAVYPMEHTCDAAGVNYLQDTLDLDVNCDGIDDSEQECITECDVKAGSTSYIGCEYWPAFLQNEEGFSTTTNVYFDLTLVMSNPSKYESATVYVFDEAAQKKSENQTTPAPKYTYTLGPGEVKTETLVGKPFGSYTNNVGTGDCAKTPNLQACKDNANNTKTNVASYMMSGTQQAARAFRVISTNPIVVYQFNPYGKPETHSADASLLMPRSVLGKEYISMGFDSRVGTSDAVTAKFADAMNIIAVEKGTTNVKVVFKAPTVAGTSGSGTIKAYKAGETGNFTLKRFDVLSLQQKEASNSTGTSITANRKIAVFGSAGCAQVPTDKSACDHLEEQLFPLQSWGTSYAAVKTHQRGTEDDYYYILAQKNDTYVDIQGGVQNKSRTLSAGEFMVINTNQNFAVKSNDPKKPILVGQFMVGSQANAAGKGDPSFILNVPVEQYRSEYAFAIPGGYQEDWVTIIAPGTTSKPPVIKYTGAGHTGYNCSNGKQACSDVDITSLPTSVFSGWKTLAGSSKVFGKQYVYGYLDLDGGTHNLSSTVQFGVTGYGFFNDTSYGYPIGLDLKILNTN